MRRPLVSIIVPSFNQGQFIRETIESCLSQDYRPIEVLVIDGASTDGTLAVLHGYDTVPEVHWVSEPDSGPVEAVNKGFALARGEVGAIQSSDDMFAPGAVADAVRYFEAEPELGMVYGQMDRIDADGRPAGQYRSGPYSLGRLLARGTHIPQPATFFRMPLARELGGWDPRIPYVPDSDLYMRIAFRSRVQQSAAVWGICRAHPEQRDRNTARIHRDYLSMIANSADLAGASPLLKAAAKAGCRILRLRYDRPASDLRLTLLLWEAVLIYPPCFFYGVIPFHRLVPGYFALTRLLHCRRRPAGGCRLPDC